MQMLKKQTLNFQMQILKIRTLYVQLQIPNTGIDMQMHKIQIMEIQILETPTITTLAICYQKELQFSFSVSDTTDDIKISHLSLSFRTLRAVQCNWIAWGEIA